MKRLITLLLITIISTTSFAKGDEKTYDFHYTNVVEVEGVSKALLYQRALGWVTSVVIDKEAIQIKDKETGHILFNGFEKLPTPVEDNLHFTFNIMVKDGRFKYIVENFYHEGSTDGGRRVGGDMHDAQPDCGRMRMTSKYWGKLKEKADMRAQVLIESFIASMNEKSEIEDF